MPSTTQLLASIKASPDGVTLAELLTQHPNVARRTAQQQIAKFIGDRGVLLVGKVVLVDPHLLAFQYH